MEQCQIKACSKLVSSNSDDKLTTNPAQVDSSNKVIFTVAGAKSNSTEDLYFRISTSDTNDKYVIKVVLNKQEPFVPKLPSSLSSNSKVANQSDS